MADQSDRADAGDPFLERRLSTLALLPVPTRPTLDDLGGRAVDGDLSIEPVADGPHRRRSHRVWTLTVAAAAAVLVVVSIVAVVVRSGDGAGVASGGAAGSLAGRAFWSLSVTEGGAPRTVPTDPLATQPPSPVTVRFDADGQSLGASAGCNTLMGRYTIDGDRLVVDDLGTTEMYCAGPLGHEDAWLSSFLTSSPTIALDGDRLTLTSGTTVIELRDRRVADPNLPLAGPRWTLESIVEGGVDTGAVAGPMTDLPAFELITLPDGHLVLDGTDGCAAVRVSVVADGPTLHLGEPVSSDELCAERFGAAAAFDALLGDDVTFAIDGSELTITNGSRQLIFAGQAAPTTPDTVVTSTPGTTVRGSDPTTPPDLHEPLTGTDAVAAVVGPRWDLEWFVVDGTRSSASEFEGSRPVWLRFSGYPERFAEVVDGGDRCGDFRADVVVRDTTIAFEPTRYVTEQPCFMSRSLLDSALEAVLAGEATYITDGATLIISRGGASLELRATDRPVVVEPIVLPAPWTDAVVAGDDRTVTLTIPCAHTRSEVPDHVDVDGVVVTAYVRVPGDRAAWQPCSEGDVARTSFTLSEPLGGRTLQHP